MKLLLTLLLLSITPIALYAQTTIDLGEGGEFVITNVVETDTAMLYYNDEELVVSAHDNNTDGITDVWLVYENGIAVLEGHNTEGNDKPDAFFRLGTDETVLNEFGPGIEALQATETDAFDPEQETSLEDDLVGSLDSITIPSGGTPWLLIILLLIGLAGGFYWWKNKQNKSGDQS